MTLLRISGLDVRYGPVAALRGIDLEVAAGEVVGVVGPNGAGKSSLLLAIAGAVRPSAGEIALDGTPIGHRRPEEIVRQGIALVPEGREIFGDLSVEENLRLGTTVRRDTAAAQAHLGELMAAFPILKERRSQRAGKLSGGEQQMLAIARALLCRPRLLLLDEPSLGLAPLITRQVYAILGDLRRQGITILVVEQNPVRVRHLADRVYLLRSGEVTASGTPEILGRPEDMAKAYFGYRRHRPAARAVPPGPEPGQEPDPDTSSGPGA